jgi:hypothetical protein
MSEPIDLEAERLKRMPHIQSEAVCIECRHKWHCVAPAGTRELECPACGTMKGRYTHVVLPAEGMVFQCKCGSYEFCLMPENALCLLCGVDVPWSDLK